MEYTVGFTLALVFCTAAAALGIDRERARRTGLEPAQRPPSPGRLGWSVGLITPEHHD
jgi:hypothetical protein